MGKYDKCVWEYDKILWEYLLYFPGDRGYSPSVQSISKAGKSCPRNVSKIMVQISLKASVRATSRATRQFIFSNGDC